MAQKINGVTYEAPNSAQMAQLAYQAALQNVYANADEMGLKSKLEKELAAQFIGGRSGKVFATKIWKYATNTSSVGEAMLDSIGLVAKPATDTEAGQDDFAEESEIFQWTRCNYTRDDDGFARPTAVEGMPGFAKTGKVDIGNVYATFWYKVENHGTYDVYYMSDAPHPELGLVPWIEAIKADGTVLPFYVHSAFYSISNEEGTSGDSKKILRSQYGVPAYNNSYNSMITEYQKKGAGYWGSGSERTLFAFLMMVIKYKTKNSQKFFRGHVDTWNAQSKIAVAEESAKRVLIADQSKFYVGACVSVGTCLDNNKAVTQDRNYATVHDVVNRAQIKSIEKVVVSGTEYTALTLDVPEAFNVTVDDYVSMMPCMSGETDKVIGHFDGSYLSNTDGCHTFRIGGTEYMNGQAIIDSNVVMQRDEGSGLWLQYVAKRGVKHVANAHTGYTLAGGIPIAEGDYWSGDIYVDPDTGSFCPCSIGGGDSIGTGDRVWGPQSGKGEDGTLREKYTVGNLGIGSYVGLCSVSCWDALSRPLWASGCCD
ncbi:hypothetical protein [Anaerolactibacter massiliensis]|uniref:hypothetical protein n=1 Tax=Anaerolactibacter massiliensis TaxID=2044573 RepID=UPI000CF8D8D3|nr:hypothetical protein [Anaerolactibacter massiliensis]